MLIAITQVYWSELYGFVEMCAKARLVPLKQRRETHGDVGNSLSSLRRKSISLSAQSEEEEILLKKTEGDLLIQILFWCLRATRRSARVAESGSEFMEMFFG